MISPTGIRSSAAKPGSIMVDKITIAAAMEQNTRFMVPPSFCLVLIWPKHGGITAENVEKSGTNCQFGKICIVRKTGCW
jgi:hypothetical protein